MVFPFQEDTFCAFNAFRNAVFLRGKGHVMNRLTRPADLDPFTCIEKIAHHVHLCGIPVRKHKARDLRMSLLKAKSGVFVFESAGHCLCWSASDKIIIDSSPLFPDAVEASAKGLKRLGVTRRSIKKVYELL